MKKTQFFSYRYSLKYSNRSVLFDYILQSKHINNKQEPYRIQAYIIIFIF